MRQIARLAPLLVIIDLLALAQRNVARMDSGASLPGTCAGPAAGHGGDQFQLTTAATGSQFYLCETTDNWVHQGGAAGGGGATTCAGNSSAGGVHYTCAGTPSGFTLTQGAQLNVSFDVTNAGTTPDLNVNSTGAIALLRKDGNSYVASELPASSKSTLFSYNSASGKFEESQLKPTGGSNGTIIFNYAVSPPTADTTGQVCQIGNACTPTGAQDMSASSAVKPAKQASSAPGTCGVGEHYFNTSSYVEYSCGPANTWTAFSSSSGGVAVVTTSGAGKLCIPACGAYVVENGQVFASKKPHYQQFVLHDQMKFTFLAVFDLVADTTSTASCGSAACGFAAAMYDKTCTKIAGTDLTTSQSMTSAAHLYSFATPFTLNPDTYFLGTVSDSTSVQIGAVQDNTVLYQLDNLTGNGGLRWATGATAATGNNTSLAMPASCGTLSAIVTYEEFAEIFP